MKFTSKMQLMTPSTFKLYVYLVEASESDDFALSRAKALKHTGLAKTTYYEALEELRCLGLMHKVGCHYKLGDLNG
jgi:hypothetical protein